MEIETSDRQQAQNKTLSIFKISKPKTKLLRSNLNYQNLNKKLWNIKQQTTVLNIENSQLRCKVNYYLRQFSRAHQNANILKTKGNLQNHPMMNKQIKSQSKQCSLYQTKIINYKKTHNKENILRQSFQNQSKNVPRRSLITANKIANKRSSGIHLITQSKKRMSTSNSKQTMTTLNNNENRLRKNIQGENESKETLQRLLQELFQEKVNYMNKINEADEALTMIEAITGGNLKRNNNKGIKDFRKIKSRKFFVKKNKKYLRLLRKYNAKILKTLNTQKKYEDINNKMNSSKSSRSPPIQSILKEHDIMQKQIEKMSGTISLLEEQVQFKECKIGSDEKQSKKISKKILELIDHKNILRKLLNNGKKQNIYRNTGKKQSKNNKNLKNQHMSILEEEQSSSLDQITKNSSKQVIQKSKQIENMKQKQYYEEDQFSEYSEEQESETTSQSDQSYSSQFQGNDSLKSI